MKKQYLEPNLYITKMDIDKTLANDVDLGSDFEIDPWTEE